MELFSLVNPVDFAVLEAVQALMHPLLTQTMLLVTFLGNPLFWVLVVALIHWKGEERKGFFLMNLIIFSTGAVAVLKPLFARARPSCGRFKVVVSPFEKFYHAAGFDFSFPSGHTTLVSSMLFYLRKGKLGVLLVAAVAAVAFSRLYLGKHFLTDVVAAVVVGFLVAELNLWIARYFERSKFRLNKVEKELAFFTALVAALIVIVFLRTASLSMLLFGYYAGLFLFKSLGLDSARVKGMAFLSKAVFGLVVPVAAVAAALQNLSVVLEYGAFFAAGLWISFLWPFLYDRVLKKTKQ